MDKISKALSRLTAKERLAVKIILEKIQKDNLDGLDIKKLKEYNDIFRIRKGKIRIICRKNETGEIYILAIERRSEKTYKL
jgi:mRNA-degrading endonuclease RelE of RelBE toxin-antitoxin system